MAVSIESVSRVVADVMGKDESDLRGEMRFIEDLGADYLDLVEVVMAFEAEFDIEINDGEIEGILTINDAVAKIKEKLLS